MRQVKKGDAIDVTLRDGYPLKGRVLRVIHDDDFGRLAEIKTKKTAFTNGGAICFFSCAAIEAIWNEGEWDNA